MVIMATTKSELSAHYLVEFPSEISMVEQD
jgi:hypothetical protein